MLNVPGARPDIAKEAYQEYRIQGNLAKEVDSYQEAAVRSWAQHQQNYNNQELDDDIYRVQELVRAMNHSRTVYIITDNGADIKFTGSKESIVGWSIDPKHISKSSIKSVGGTINAVSDFRYETRQQPKGSKWEDTNIEYTDLNKSLLQNTLNERLENEETQFDL